MKYYTKMAITAAAISALAFPVSAQTSRPFTLDAIAWIAGSWEGVGPNSYDGSEQVLSTWTPPKQGVMSYTFRYNTPADGHVHFAFHVLQETDEGVMWRGIHRAPDFTTYEDTHWTYRMVEADGNTVKFECLSGCRGAVSLTYEMKESGELQEQYKMLDETKPLSIFKYTRAK